MENNAMECASENSDEQAKSSLDICGSGKDGSESRHLRHSVLATDLALLESSSSESEDDVDTVVVRMLNREEELNAIDLGLLLHKRRRNSIKEYIKTTVASYTESKFRMHFRISRKLFENLCQRFAEWDIFKKLRQDKKLSVEAHMLVFLWFAGHQACSYRDLSHRFKLPLSSIKLVVERVTMFLSSLSPQTIKWPTAEKMEQSSKFFATKCLFSKAIGCIGLSHIVIDPPSKSKDDYIDREENVSVCLQGICDENKKIIDMFVGYPGSCHESWVFQNSSISDKLPTYCGDYFLLGDSAYPCNKYLVTPYRDNGNLTSTQKEFNINLRSGRYRIEQTFRILKQRFRQLYNCKVRGMKMVCHFIRACCVLHNIAVEDDLEFNRDENPDYSEEFADHDEVRLGNSVRNAISAEIQTNITALNKE